MSFDSSGYVLPPDGGPQLWFLDTRMNIKAGGAQTGGAFTLIEWSAPAGFGPPLHVHGVDDEGFYILDGEISIECGSKHFTAGPGDFTFLPRGIPHTFLVTRGPVRGLQITAPAGFEDFIAEAGPPSGRACPNPPNPTSRAWPRPRSATAARSSARHQPRRHGDPPPFPVRALFSSSDSAGLKDVDGLGQLPGTPTAAAEFAQDAPGFERGAGALAW